MASEAFFLPVAEGYRFCLFHAPRGEPKGAVLYLHPFAEEMNKSRRMAALQSHLLAEQGFGVLQIDLLGCGDSSGDFGDATWAAWLNDVRMASDWLRSRCTGPLWYWGLRTGCLLAAEAAGQAESAVNLFFWQPVVSGKAYLQQFLRLKVAGQMMSGDSKGMMTELKNSLASGASVEIAGYRLSSALARGLENAELPPPSRVGKVVWLELSSRPDGTLLPVSTRCIDQWRSAGIRVDSAVTQGLTFWQTTEIEEAPALLTTTTASLAA